MEDNRPNISDKEFYQILGAIVTIVIIAMFVDPVLRFLGM
jgi:hypothetical protein